MAERKRRLCRRGLLLLLAGAAYAGFVALTGWGLPCPFRLLTGLLCPGCGVSRMCMALLRGDLQAAWAANPAILCLLPFLLAVAARLCWLYVHTGRARSKGTDAALYGMIAVLLVFGVVRNVV